MVREEKALGAGGHAATVLFPAQLRSGPHTVLPSSVCKAGTLGSDLKITFH